MHVAFVCNELPPASSGGIGHVVLALAKGIAAEGHKVMVVGTYDADYGWSYPGISVRPVLDWRAGNIIARRLKGPLAQRRDAISAKLAEVDRETPVDIVEWPDYQGLLKKGTGRAADIIRAHGSILSFEADASRGEKADFERKAFSAADGVIFVSDFSRRLAGQRLGLGRQIVDVIHNPIDLGIFRPRGAAPQAQRTVLFAGSLCERKGLFSAAAAANIFLQGRPDVRFRIAGRIYDRRDLNRLEQIVDPALRHQVDVLHEVPQTVLAAMMREATVFLSPSYDETFGNTWAEAMASGVPVVASTRASGPEVVSEGAGFCADPDHPDEIAGHVARLLDDRELARAMGAEGRKLAEQRYAAGSAVKASLDFYAKVLTAKSNGASRT